LDAAIIGSRVAAHPSRQSATKRWWSSAGVVDLLDRLVAPFEEHFGEIRLEVDRFPEFYGAGFLDGALVDQQAAQMVQLVEG
jgi:hypothetical protein